MTTHTRRLLVVITEAALERQLVADVRQFGVHGYTITDVRGGGRSGERESTWEADRSIEMKVICDPAVADELAAHFLATYAEHYAVVLFTTDVGVFRPQKF